jgi:AcrR family transcriptional regulator
MIYYYFGSKDGLYAAVLERAYTDFRKVEQNIDYAALDPVEALRTLIGNTFDVHVRNPHLIRVFMSENLDQGRHVMTIDHSGQRELVMNTVRAILVRGAAQGILRDDMDPLHFHHSVSALSFYAVSNRFTFGAVFGIDPASADWLAARRSEVIETMLARCRNHG